MLRSTLLAVVVFGFGAGARAEGPKTPDVNLDDLKDALAVADRRGDNVEPIREALAALEKALAVSLKPGEAPLELTILREAVEAAAKKGEHVEGISTELGRVEKALTGRAYERPKPPEPKPEPEVIPVPVRPGRGNPWNGRAGGFGGGAAGRVGPAFNSTSITVSDGVYTLRARRGDVTYEVTGPVEAGGKAPKIVVQDGDKKTETDDIKKVPEEHRPAVERLMRTIIRG